MSSDPRGPWTERGRTQRPAGADDLAGARGPETKEGTGTSRRENQGHDIGGQDAGVNRQPSTSGGGTDEGETGNSVGRDCTRDRKTDGTQPPKLHPSFCRHLTTVLFEPLCFET